MSYGAQSSSNETPLQGFVVLVVRSGWPRGGLLVELPHMIHLTRTRSD